MSPKNYTKGLIHITSKKYIYGIADSLLENFPHIDKVSSNMTYEKFNKVDK